MRFLLLVIALGVTAACSAKTTEGNSNGVPSGGTPAGTPAGTTSCVSSETASSDGGTSGALNGKPVIDLALPGPPCPVGYVASPHQHPAGTAYVADVGPVRTFTTEAELGSSNFCIKSGDAGTDPDAGTGFDWSTHDVVGVTFLAYTSASAPPLTDVGGQLYVLRSLTWCGIDAPQGTDWFYAVPKGKTVHWQDCKTTCSRSN